MKRNYNKCESIANVQKSLRCDRCLPGFSLFGKTKSPVHGYWPLFETSALNKGFLVS